VAFDIETTGTFGAAAGDSSPEITEIGAVKVVDGQIVDRFSKLADPGRKIVPRIARLTHITDEMVRGKPPIADVIRKFKEFVGKEILVGHNIKNCDIPYIIKAAKRAGVAFDNQYFDTYRYAKKKREENHWDNVKLEYLSRQFGIEQPDAHRAWCDAEANVGVYFKLKELGEG
jgi:DNA polymerase III epsilon subunit family exonuclease